VTETTSDLVVSKAGATLSVTFSRPAQHNAMTFAMYEGMHDACERADSDEEIRAMVLRGAGGRAFVSGTDISQFGDFTDGADGVEYEKRISRVVDRLEDVTVPTVAAVNGYCVGGGLVIAAVCDLRVATRRSRFGAPIARTLGNCLSMNTYSILVAHLGPARTLDLVLRARMLSGEEAHAAGFVTQLCEDDELDQTVEGTLAELVDHAPLTMWATKESVKRLRRAGLPAGDDVVERVFGSDDFHAAVRRFGTDEPRRWTGR
jgi:enoyl-CoA hydratase/carnithine racemase